MCRVIPVRRHFRIVGCQYPECRQQCHHFISLIQQLKEFRLELPDSPEVPIVVEPPPPKPPYIDTYMTNMWRLWGYEINQKKNRENLEYFLGLR